MILSLLITLLLVLVPVVTLRLLYILPHSRLAARKPKRRRPGCPTHLLIVLGSGGHTAEMLSLIRNLEPSKYQHRTYVVSSGDNFSAGLARAFEQRLFNKSSDDASPVGDFAIATVPRARKIHQSIFTAPFSSLYCLMYCLKLLKFGPPESQIQKLSGPSTKSSAQELAATRRPITPNLIVTNGPATGVIIVLASLIIRFFAFLPAGPRDSATSLTDQTPGSRPRGDMRTIYVESWARVRRLSLSGKILLQIVDRFIVQWERLIPETKGRGEYLGVLVE